MKRNYLSGAQKRKLAEEKKQKTDEITNKLPKLTSFFQFNASSENTKHTAPEPVDKGKSNSECANVTEITENRSSTDDQSDIISEDLNVSRSDEVQNKNKSNDPGAWGKFCSDEIAYWIDRGPADCQHHNTGPFEKSRRSFNDGKQTRYCSQKLFSGTKKNGETYVREWLLYSPSTGSVYCFVCKLFAPKSTSTSFVDGFSDWRNNVLIEHHENSMNHRDAMLKYLSRRNGFKLTNKLEEQIKTEREYWQHVLQRVVAVIRTLAERGLPFRGSDEKFGSPHNGNFMGLLELIAQFDPFLATHISKYGNSGKGNPSYLSKTICDELINLLAKNVRSVILDEIKSAGYFSLCVDSTPDLSHIDQLSVVLRYVSPIDGKPIERFLTFLALENHVGAEMANQVLDYLCNECKIDFLKCRSQSYDNAPNMSGCYKGMQAKILEKNKYAIFIPCGAHSLNLIGRTAVDSCPKAVSFFSLVQLLFNYFSSSVTRWGLLTSVLGKDQNTLKTLSNTRWEAHAVATEAIVNSYSAILDILNIISEDPSQKGEAKETANNIAQKMEEFEFVFMMTMWNEILQSFHRTSKALQNEKLNLKKCVNLYKSLADYLHNLREDFDRFEKIAKDILPGVDYKAANSRRRVRKKQVNDGNAPEANLSPKDEFRVKTFYVILDTLEVEMNSRAMKYNEINDKFSFLVNNNLSKDEYIKESEKLINLYPDDLNSNLSEELQQFHHYANSKIENNNICFSYSDFYSIIFDDKLDYVFPNVEIALRIFLTLMVTNCSAERSFSQLKRLKNPLRTTIRQERLDSLSLLCIEADILRQIDINIAIQDFAAKKCRKRIF